MVKSAHTQVAALGLLVCTKEITDAYKERNRKVQVIKRLLPSEEFFSST